jgi:hypothetical protein
MLKQAKKLKVDRWSHAFDSRRYMDDKMLWSPQTG